MEEIKETLYSHKVSHYTQEYKGVAANYKEYLRGYWEVKSYKPAPHPGETTVLLVALCFGKCGEFGPGKPLCLKLTLPFHSGVRMEGCITSSSSICQQYFILE